MDDLDKTLMDIYKRRKLDCLRLIEKGVDFDQMQRQVQHYQDYIDEFFPKKTVEIPKWTLIPIIRLLGSNFTPGEDKYSCRKKDTTIDGKQVYCRLFVKRIGWEIYLGDGYSECVFDNANEEDMEWFKSYEKKVV